MGIWKDKFGYVAEENETLRAEIARLNAAFTSQHHSTWKNAYMKLSKATWEIKMEAEKLKADNRDIISALVLVKQERDALKATNYCFLRAVKEHEEDTHTMAETIARLRKLLEVKTKELHSLREQYRQRTQDNQEATDGTD